VRVRLGIEHSSSETSRSQEESSSNTYYNGGPDGEESTDDNLSLLSSVGEVVVSGAHEIEASGLVHSDETSIEVLRSSVELHAVAWVSLDGVLVVVVLLLQVSKTKTVGLSKHAHPLSEFLGLKERSVLGNPIIRSRERSIKVRDLDHVASVGSLGSFSCISSWVSVASGPLEVDIISSTSNKESGDKIIFSGGVSLDNVSSLSTDVKVENSLKRRDSSGSGSNVEHVGSVLEGSSELRGIDGKRNVEPVLSNVRILSDRGVSSVLSPINKSRIGSVSIASNIVGGDVVSKSQYAIAVIIIDARLILVRRNSPVEAGLESIDAVTQMVISRPSSFHANGSGNSPRRYFDPFVTSSKASRFVIFGSLSIFVIWVGAIESGLDVLRFLLVEVAPGKVVSQNGNVSPGGWGPIRIIISLLGAFETVSISVVILSGIHSSVSVQVSLLLSIGNKETLISLSGLASIVKDLVFVHSKSEKSVGISGSDSSIRIGDSVGGGSISNSISCWGIFIGAHVLNNQVAVNFGVLSATVLDSPLDGQ